MIQYELLVFAQVHKFISRLFLAGNFWKKLLNIRKPSSFETYFLFVHKCSNAQENPPEVEGTVKTLSGEILTSRVVVQRLKILGGQCPILLITLAFYEKIQHRGLPPPIVKVRKRKVITAMVRKVKIMTSKKNPHPKRDMASRVNVSKYTVSPILKRFDLVKRNKHRFRDATISCTTRKSSPTLERSNKR